MNTYVVTNNSLSPRLNRSIHITQANSPKEAAKNALTAYEFAIPLSLTSPSEEPQTFIAYDGQDWSENEVLEGYRTTFDCIEATILKVAPVESLLGKTVSAGSLAEIPAKAPARK